MSDGGSDDEACDLSMISLPDCSQSSCELIVSLDVSREVEGLSGLESFPDSEPSISAGTRARMSQSPMVAVGSVINSASRASDFSCSTTMFSARPEAGGSGNGLLEAVFSFGVTDSPHGTLMISFTAARAAETHRSSSQRISWIPLTFEIRAREAIGLFGQSRYIHIRAKRFPS